MIPRILILEILAAGLVVVTIAAVPAGIWWYDDYSFRARFGDDVRIITLTASADQGRVTEEHVGGLNYWSGRFNRAQVITVDKGEKVALVITSADVTHSFVFPPGFPVKDPIEMEGGHTAVAEFVAERPGNYLAECKAFCGCAHHGMFFSIVVVDPQGKDRASPDTSGSRKTE